MNDIIQNAQPIALPRDNALADPVVTRYHSVLTINADRKLYHFSVDKQTGTYRALPEELTLTNEGYRKVFNIAGETPPAFDAPADAGSNVAVALLPIKDEPNSSFICCYLLNARHLHVTNTWTVAEWSDQLQVDARIDPENVPDFSPRRLLVATAQGVVYDLDIPPDARTLDLAENPEVWRLLRNGCLAGEAMTAAGLTPLINLASFTGSVETHEVKPEDLVAGTWDFKWPTGKTLRVAFMPVHSTDPEAATVGKGRACDLARTWLPGTSLDVRFFDYDGSQDYDILVSLDDLPTVVPGGRARQPRTIHLPCSELGSYAARMDYGVPTLYLGWPKGIKDERGKEITDGYFHSRLFAHITLHEFGHALGLPHLHQHPELENPFKSAPTVQAVLLEKMGIEMSEAEVIEELILRWPGSTAYGDWLDIGNQTGPELAARSVMMGLPAQQVYRAETSSGLEYFTALGELDTQWIQALYGR